MLATAPADVKLLFDDAVRPAGGDRAVDAAGRSVLGGPVHRLKGNDRALVVPLRAGLGRGAYTVRWRAVSDDGHLLTGVLAFAVGTGSPKPVPTLAAGGGLSVGSVLLRLLLFAGVLVAGGAAVTARRLLGPGPGRLDLVVVAAGLGLVAAGGFGLLALEPAVEPTRFGRVVETAAIVALVGVAVALASVAIPPLRYVVPALAIAELAVPTLAGHALDPHRLRALVALADFVHVAAAAIWVGGLVLLVLSRSGRARERFPALALVAVGLLVAGAIPRALAAFPSVGDAVHTGYGQALLVKTGLLAAILGIAWTNRRRIRRLGLAGELVLLAGVIAAVGALTELRPPARAAVALPVVPARPLPPPPDAVVLAQEDDDVAVGLAASPRGKEVAVVVTALGPDGRGVDGLDVRIAGTAAGACPGGCYRATVPLPAPPRTVVVSLAGPGAKPATLTFRLPRRWPAPVAANLVARVDRVYRALDGLVVHERLGSNARNAITTTYRVAPPDRLAYRIAGGPEAVIIGGERWDRLPGGRWKRSDQEPLTQPEPFWGPDPRHNARLLDPGRVGGTPVVRASFYDPRLPAWFELSIDPRNDRLLALKMTAQAHFMQHRYSAFDRPQHIVPPVP